MVVGCVFEVFFGSAGDEEQLLVFGVVLQVEADDLFHDFVDDLVADFRQGGDLDGVGLVIVLVRLVDVLREPLTFLLFLLADQLGAGLQMPLELLGGDEKALLVGALDLILQIAAVSRAKFGVDDGCELALPPLPLDEVLANQL